MSGPGYLGDKKIPHRLLSELDDLKNRHGVPMVLQALADVVNGHTYDCPDGDVYEKLALGLTRMAGELSRGVQCQGKQHRGRT